MELIEKKTGRKVNIKMFIIDTSDEKPNDVSYDFFDGCTVVKDIDYCIDKVKDWVVVAGDFSEEGVSEMRLAVINDELFNNYKI